MANSYFKFKQFTIHQDRSAMKVCTDACIFGAWIANKNLEVDLVLDIGAGTGLLMLMLAQQRQKAIIHGIEIDANSFEQLSENISGSKWRDRLIIHHADIRSANHLPKFDFIISNPPFHEKSLQTGSVAVDTARHSEELNLKELMIAIHNNLSTDGTFAVLLPFYRVAEFEKLAGDSDFYLQEKILIKQSPAHGFFRGILFFGRKKLQNILQEELIIEEKQGVYSTGFVGLLKDYYLHL
jgi:tRNA1Val (adenine37-N6)-methyltransferase